jgi:endonuclease/exonuclease/phosphatase family metal-dependent hydrolase
MAYAGGAYGCGIVSRERIRDYFYIALPKGEGSEPRVCVVIETRRYVYAACHLDHIGEAARLEQARVLTAELQRRYGNGRKPVFLAGDFNDTPDSALLRQLSRDWTLLSPLEYSYSAKQPHVCIDYIFVLHGGPKVSVSASGVPTSFAYGDVETASDHLPLFVDVVF